MIVWPLLQSLRRDSNLAPEALAATPGTSVSTGTGTAKTATPVQLIASAAFDVYWIRIYAWGYGLAATTRKCRIDIMVGGAGSEIVLIADLLAGSCGNITLGGRCWDFPLFVRAGTRISCRAAGSTASTAFRVGIMIYGGTGYPPWPVFTKCVTYGAGTSPAGTAVVTATSETTPGGPTGQIVAATTEDHACFVPSFQLPTDTTITPAKHYQVSMGRGGSGSERFLGESRQHYIFTVDANEMCNGPLGGCIPVFERVPSGTRLSMEFATSGGGDAADAEGAIHALS